MHKPDLEWQARARKIRAAARHGKSATDIAALYGLPVVAVQQTLKPVDHPRLSDPVDLIGTGHAVAGKAAMEVQLYWLGFLTAAGYIHGQGSSLTLTVTLGEEGRDRLELLLADLMMGYTRCEVCESSLVGWQGYLRDPALCKALIAWGVPSTLYGEDPAMLEDLPEGFVGPYLRGYVDGSELDERDRAPRRTGFVIRGTPAALAGINSLVHRWWGISTGVVTKTRKGTELRFADAATGRAIQGRLSATA